MADDFSGRDPDAVGYGMMAYFAVAGQENPSHILDFFRRAATDLLAISKRAHENSDQETSAVTSEIAVALLAMEEAFDPNGKSRFKLQLTQRKAGRPPQNLNIRARRGRQAAFRVERMVAEGIKQESAIATVSAETEISRAELLKWMKSNRSIRGRLKPR